CLSPRRKHALATSFPANAGVSACVERWRTHVLVARLLPRERADGSICEHTARLDAFGHWPVARWPNWRNSLDSRKGDFIWSIQLGICRYDFPTGSNDGNAGQTTTIKHALIDFDGDGAFEIASAGYSDGVRAIDPRDGKTLWSLSAPTPTCHRVVAANIDGHPGEELLYASGNKLVAITGDRSAGKILWEWQGPAALGMPAIADIDGDGLAEIIVQAADG